MKNVVRENINEIFHKDSDPISDMNIGGIILKPEFDKLYEEFKNKWVEYLRETISVTFGKKVKGEFQKNKLNDPYKTYTFIVKEASFYFKDEEYKQRDTHTIIISPGIIFISEEDNAYFNDGNHKFYILD